MIRFTYEGKEFEFRGQYGRPQQGEYLLNIRGEVEQEIVGIDTEEYAIVHPVPVIHEFGGIKFVETGEIRVLSDDEFGLRDDGMLMHNWHNKWAGPYTILKPLEQYAR